MKKRQVTRHTSQGKDSAWLRRALLTCSWALCLVSCVFFVSGCATINPATGKKEFVLFSTATEVMMGEEIHSSLAGEVKFSDDKVASEKLSKIGQRLAQVSDRQDLQYHFYLVNKDEVNAFTVPGGSVYFYNGLYSKLNSADQVAAVLAHEIGHTAAKHTIKKFQMAMGYDLLGAIVFSKAQTDIAVQVARMGADVLMNLGMSAYSRSDEYEADRLAVKYMYLAGYRPEAIIETFEILAQNSKGEDNDWLLLRSHPYIKDRITMVKKEIETVKGKY